MKKPMQIHTFDPVIYPIKLFVVKYPNEKEINNRFTANNGDYLNYSLMRNAHATTEFRIVTLNEIDKFGVLIVLHSGKITVGHMAHEATHAARVIWDWLTENTTGAEADAYLVGWISDYINQVRINKFK